MSSAANHAKRSRRSYHYMQVSANTTWRKTYAKQQMKPRRVDLLKKLAAFIHRPKQG